MSNDFTNRVRENYNRQRERRRKLQKLQRLSLGIVVVAMFVLVGVWFFISSRSGGSTQEIAARYLGEPHLEATPLREAYTQLQNQHADLALAQIAGLTEDPQLGDEAEWFTALALLQRGDNVMARTYLERIVDQSGDHPRAVQASRALEELNALEK